MNILVIDCGTTSIRGILFSEQGRPLCTKQISSSLVAQGEFIEQEPRFYADALISICDEISQRHAIDAVSLTAFRSAPTLLDEQGMPLCRFIMWHDRRNQSICRELSDHNRYVRKKCGAGINTVFTGTKLTWLKRNRPELWALTKKALVVPDFLAHLMTGAHVTDKTYGSRTLLMDLESGQWDDELCSIFSVERDKLCELVESGVVIGNISESFSIRSGLPVGVPVISAGGDQQCAALGLGVVEEGKLAVNLGTGGYVMALSDKPIVDCVDAICNRAALPGKFILETGLASCAPAFREYIDTFHPEFDGNMKLLDQLVEEGLGGAAERARAFYEDMAVKISQCVRKNPGFRKNDEPICIAGGIANSSAFSAMLSRAIGRRLICWHNPEATAIGAFATAAATLGVFPSIPAALNAIRSNDSRETFKP